MSTIATPLTIDNMNPNTKSKIINNIILHYLLTLFFIKEVVIVAKKKRTALALVLFHISYHKVSISLFFRINNSNTTIHQHFTCLFNINYRVFHNSFSFINKFISIIFDVFLAKNNSQCEPKPTRPSPFYQPSYCKLSFS